jgi:ammonia channel protein AmtB
LPHKTLHTLPGSVDTFYLIICGALVFFTQAGFGLHEAGSVRTKNARNILIPSALGINPVMLLLYPPYRTSRTKLV